jgi:hypothetical protein
MSTISCNDSRFHAAKMRFLSDFAICQTKGAGWGRPRISPGWHVSDTSSTARMFYQAFPNCDALRHELSWTH